MTQMEGAAAGADQGSEEDLTVRVAREVLDRARAV
jgi:hypothetical protein